MVAYILVLLLKSKRLLLDPGYVEGISVRQSFLHTHTPAANKNKYTVQSSLDFSLWYLCSLLLDGFGGHIVCHLCWHVKVLRSQGDAVQGHNSYFLIYPMLHVGVTCPCLCLYCRRETLDGSVFSLRVKRHETHSWGQFFSVKHVCTIQLIVTDWDLFTFSNDKNLMLHLSSKCRCTGEWVRLYHSWCQWLYLSGCCCSYHSYRLVWKRWRYGCISSKREGEREMQQWSPAGIKLGSFHVWTTQKLTKAAVTAEAHGTNLPTPNFPAYTHPAKHCWPRGYTPKLPAAIQKFYSNYTSVP